MATSEESRLPYATLGKPGEQIGLFDSYIGNIMKKLHDLKIAENTFVIFTSDNGPDGGAGRGVFHMYNKYNHMRMGMMRGNKASIYEGGHRVPMLTWWPLGTHQALHGTNFDLPANGMLK